MPEGFFQAVRIIDIAGVDRHGELRLEGGRLMPNRDPLELLSTCPPLFSM
jgi:hypothetical protein